MKRVLLFLATNLAVMLVLSLFTSLLGVNRFLTANGLDLGMLLAFSAVIEAWFDPAFYAGAYPDVVAASVDPLWHYSAHGAAEMRDPNRWFSTRFYVETNPGVLASGDNPLLHYVEKGHREDEPLLHPLGVGLDLLALPLQEA